MLLKLTTTALQPIGFQPPTKIVLMSSNGLGYYVRGVCSQDSQDSGEKFYYINTDFSFIKSQYTVDNPLLGSSTNNNFVKGTLNEPNRPKQDGRYSTVDRPTACSHTRLQAQQDYMQRFARAQLQRLSKGGGKVHFRFKVRSSGGEGQGRQFNPKNPGHTCATSASSPTRTFLPTP